MIVFGVLDHFVPMSAQQIGFRGEHRVFAAGLLVEVVNHEDAHWQTDWSQRLSVLPRCPRSARACAGLLAYRIHPSRLPSGKAPDSSGTRPVGAKRSSSASTLPADSNRPSP